MFVIDPGFNSTSPHLNNIDEQCTSIDHVDGVFQCSTQTIFSHDDFLTPNFWDSI